MHPPPTYAVVLGYTDFRKALDNIGSTTNKSPIAETKLKHYAAVMSRLESAVLAVGIVC